MSVNEKLRSAQHDELFEGILQLQTVEECYAFFFFVVIFYCIVFFNHSQSNYVMIQ